MKPAQERLKVDLDAISFADPHVPLVNNWKAEAVTAAAAAREGLYQQVPNPVQWTDSILALRSLGAEVFIESGSGSVLSGLCRQIDPAFKGAKFGEPADWEKIHELLA